MLPQILYGNHSLLKSNNKKSKTAFQKMWGQLYFNKSSSQGRNIWINHYFKSIAKSPAFTKKLNSHFRQKTVWFNLNLVLPND